MEWEALLEDACPQCGEMLPDAVKGLITCRCGFSIHEDRKGELCEKMEAEREGDSFYKQGR